MVTTTGNVSTPMNGLGNPNTSACLVTMTEPQDRIGLMLQLGLYPGFLSRSTFSTASVNAAAPPIRPAITSSRPVPVDLRVSGSGSASAPGRLDTCAGMLVDICQPASAASTAAFKPSYVACPSNFSPLRKNVGVPWTPSATPSCWSLSTRFCVSADATSALNLAKSKPNSEAKPSKTDAKLTRKIIEEFRAKEGVEKREITDQEIVERTLYTMVNEGAKILEEGMAQRASDIDVVWVYGYGWPVYRGGPMFWADTEGLTKIVEGLRSQTERLGSEFSLSELLVRKAEAGEKLSR